MKPPVQASAPCETPVSSGPYPGPLSGDGADHRVEGGEADEGAPGVGEAHPSTVATATPVTVRLSVAPPRCGPSKNFTVTEVFVTTSALARRRHRAAELLR